MTTLLEIKERIRGFCSKYEIYIVGAVKAIIAFVAFFLINSRIGYMDKINSLTLVLVLSLTCALLPATAMIAFASLLIIMHLFALSKAATLAGFCIIAIMFLLYFRFSPKKGYYAVLTPIFHILGIPYAMPIIIGLMDENPISLVSMVCGSILYYFLNGIHVNAVAISEMTEEDTIFTKVTEVINQFLGNREMIIVTAVLALTVLIVWSLRRLPVDHSWTIANITGVLMQIVIFVAYYVSQSMSQKIFPMVVGVLAAGCIGVVLQFFFFNLDYMRTERVQFEDDEYYYYVKAVPKIYVSTTEKKVQKFSGDDRPISKKEITDDFDEEIINY